MFADECVCFLVVVCVWCKQLGFKIFFVRFLSFLHIHNNCLPGPAPILADGALTDIYALVIYLDI